MQCDVFAVFFFLFKKINTVGSELIFDDFIEVLHENI